MTVSEQIAIYLLNNGVSQIFTVTGGGAMFLNKAFDDVFGEAVCYMHHEQACAMAAEGFARISGVPAVVNTTTGPGAINAMNGVFGAFTDSIPMIVLSGQVKLETLATTYNDAKLRQLGDQEAKVIEMVAPICKYAVTIKSVEELAVVVPKALALATEGRPGPVWIDIPADIQMASDSLSFIGYESNVEGSELDPRKLKSVIDGLITKARRPLILAGTGIRLSGTVDQLLNFSANTGIPVATAWTHDLIESASPLFVGRPGTIGTRPGNICLQNADLVLVLGSRLNIRQTGFNYSAFAKNAVIVHVDIDKSELDKFYLNSQYKLNVDLRYFFKAMGACRKTKRSNDFFEWRSWCHTIGREFSIEKEKFKTAPPGAVNPYRAMLKISELLPEHSVIACGNASACIIPFQCISIKPGQRLFSNSGSASMGYGLPAAIGASLAKYNGSHGLVICITGDGSIQMNIQELQTISSNNFNIKIILINNGGYLSIKSTHNNFFGKTFGSDPSSGIGFPDFCRVAAAYGLATARVTSMDDLNALESIFLSDTPTLIEVIVDPDQEFCPKLRSRLNEEGKFETPELDDMYPYISSGELAALRRSASKI